MNARAFHESAAPPARAGGAGQGPAGTVFRHAVADAIGRRIRDLWLSAAKIMAVIGAWRLRPRRL